MAKPTDELEEEAKVARDRLIAELWKRGHADGITPESSYGELRAHIEAIEDDEDREMLLDRYETMHDATHHLSTRLMVERGVVMEDDDAR